jgi:hypothetical protein
VELFKIGSARQHLLRNGVKTKEKMSLVITGDGSQFAMECGK